MPRLSKITTRTGDAGETGLGDGARVPKDSARIQALGDIDELNSALGLVLAEELPEAVRAVLLEAQHDLFDLGGELSIPGHQLLREEQVARLEQALEAWNADLPALKEFILPGGSRAAAMAHLARTICRRAERSVVRLAQSGEGRGRSPWRRAAISIGCRTSCSSPGGCSTATQGAATCNGATSAGSLERSGSGHPPGPAGGLRQAGPGGFLPPVPGHVRETVWRRAAYIEA